MAESARTAWMALQLDMNGDGELGLADAWLWIVHAFFLPGDTLVWMLLSHAPALARLLELGAASYGGAFSGACAAAIWLAGFLLVRALYRLVRDIDRALTQWVARGYNACMRQARVTRIWLFCQLRGLVRVLTLRSPKPGTGIGLREVELDELELEALRSHALLAPGYVLSAGDLAISLDIRRSEAQQLLVKLERLSLLERGFGASDGETGYRLSSPGQFLVMARSGLARD